MRGSGRGSATRERPTVLPSRAEGRPLAARWDESGLPARWAGTAPNEAGSGAPPVGRPVAQRPARAERPVAWAQTVGRPRARPLRRMTPGRSALGWAGPVAQTAPTPAARRMSAVGPRPERCRFRATPCCRLRPAPQAGLRGARRTPPRRPSIGPAPPPRVPWPGPPGRGWRSWDTSRSSRHPHASSRDPGPWRSSPLVPCRRSTTNTEPGSVLA
jgi:hypothetical protein